MRIDPLAGALALLVTSAATRAAAQTPPVGGASATPNGASGTTDTTTNPDATATVPTTPPPPPPGAAVQSEAVAHYERGRVYYAAGRYRASITELSRAITLDPGGYNLYFDLGLVYERLGRVDEALISYQHYLARVQDPAEHERAERIVRRLEGARAELADVDSHPGRADPLFWGIAAGSLALLVTGGVVAITAAGADAHADDLRRMGAAPPTVQSAVDSASAQHLVADVGLIAGGGLAIAAGLLYVLREAPPRNPPVCVTASIGRAPGAALVLRF